MSVVIEDLFSILITAIIWRHTVNVNDNMMTGHSVFKPPPREKNHTYSITILQYFNFLLFILDDQPI